MSKLVCLMTFDTRALAGLAKSILEENGIDASVSADDGGGMRPDIGFSSVGVKLFVLEKNVSKAMQVLQHSLQGRADLDKAESASSDAEVVFNCEECGEELSFPAKRRGRVETCPFCYKYVDVPE